MLAAGSVLWLKKRKKSAKLVKRRKESYTRQLCDQRLGVVEHVEDNLDLSQDAWVLENDTLQGIGTLASDSTVVDVESLV